VCVWCRQSPCPLGRGSATPSIAPSQQARRPRGRAHGRYCSNGARSLGICFLVLCGKGL
jgi:hypothetical protein